MREGKRGEEKDEGREGIRDDEDQREKNEKRRDENGACNSSTGNGEKIRIGNIEKMVE